MFFVSFCFHHFSNHMWSHIARTDLWIGCLDWYKNHQLNSYPILRRCPCSLKVVLFQPTGRASCKATVCFSPAGVHMSAPLSNGFWSIWWCPSDMANPNNHQTIIEYQNWELFFEKRMLGRSQRHGFERISDVFYFVLIGFWNHLRRNLFPGVSEDRRTAFCWGPWAFQPKRPLGLGVPGGWNSGSFWWFPWCYAVGLIGFW